MLDYNKKTADELMQKSLWLLDMDGTIYEENRIFDGTLDLLDSIVKSGGQYVFLTNNSSKSVEDYIKKVTKSENGAYAGGKGLEDMKQDE